MNHDLAIAFEAMLTSVANEAASEAMRQFRIEKHQRQQDGECDRLLLRSHEVAEQLAISTGTLERLTRSGEIPCVRLGRLVRYSTDMLRERIRQKEMSDEIDQPVRAAKKTSRSIERKSIVSHKAVKNKPGKEKAEPKETGNAKKKRPAGRETPPARRESEGNKRVSPLDDLLDELGVERNDIPPVTNGDLKRIAESDTVTMHGWLYLGRALPESDPGQVLP